MLNPSNPEKLWKAHFQSSPGEPGIGRIMALKNYTQQVSVNEFLINFPERKKSELKLSGMKIRIKTFRNGNQN